MTEPSTAFDLRETPTTTDFGNFYPIGYIVVAFPRLALAEQVQQQLLAAGFEPKGAALYTSEEVVKAAGDNLADNRNLLRNLGQSNEAVQSHLAAAQTGSTFLLIHAPSDEDTERAMEKVRGVQFDFAHRYHSMAMEELT